MAEQTISSDMKSNLIEAGLSIEDADKMSKNVQEIMSTDAKSSEKWRQISKKILRPNHPFAVHQYLFKSTYDENSDKNEPNFIWIPSKEEMEQTNLFQYMQSQKKKNIHELFEWADQNRETFWQSMVRLLKISYHPQNTNTEETVFDLSTNGIESPIYFPNKLMNACDLILTGDDSRTAIVWSKEGELDKSENPILHSIDMGTLRDSVCKIAHSLINKLGLKKGDAVGIDMPMNWQSVAIYLGIIRAGMSVVSIADSFAPKAIEIRLKISAAKAIFTQDVIARNKKKIPLYDRVTEAAADLNLRCIVIAEANDNTLQCQLRDEDMQWIDFMKCDDDSYKRFESVACDSMHIANILFSSGTTGEPKAIPWHHSTFIKPLVDGYLHNDVGSVQNEVIAWPTNVGWMMGPWLIAQMGLGTTIALFVGSPVTSQFCKFVEVANVAHLGVIPSMVKAWMRSDATKDCNWQCVRRYSSTGEASNPTLYHWLVSRSYYSPCLEYVGGTEIAGGYLGGTMCQPQLLSSFSCACFGLNVHIIDDQGDILPNEMNLEGELAISVPSCGLSTTLLNKDHKNVYYDGMKDNLRRHGDQLRIVHFSKEYGAYYQHLGRVDDTMNLGGIKISSIALENVILRHPLLSREVAAISYRQSDIDQEELVICCVPKVKDDLFVIECKKKPIGFQLAPVKDNDKICVLYKVEEEKEFVDYKPHIDEQPVIYRIDDEIVYDKVEFDKVIGMIKETEISEDKPMRISFLRQRFNPKNVRKELQNLVKKELNPLFRVRDLYLINKLPRTASGKVMRRILRTDYSKSSETMIHID